MDLLSVIRRWALRDELSIREIARRTSLSRNTIRKYLRSDVVEVQFKVPGRASKLDAFSDKLSGWLKTEANTITLHEAAHGYVARIFGDDTAWRLGRVSFNPLRHVDLFGTVLLPTMLLVSHAPFLFGYAKPVPVNFGQLRQPRRDMIWVAAAGPGMNIALAIAAALLVHVVGFLPSGADRWVLSNLVNAININVFLAVFNMIPLPPLDGGRVAVGVLPNVLAAPLAALEPYGMMIMIGVFFLLPALEAQVGLHTNLFANLVTRPATAVIQMIMRLTGVA